MGVRKTGTTLIRVSTVMGTLYLEIQMKEEIKRVCEIKEVSHAAMQLCERENKNQIALMVYNQETEEIYTRLMQQIDAEKRVDKIKEILKKI